MFDGGSGYQLQFLKGITNVSFQRSLEAIAPPHNFSGFFFSETLNQFEPNLATIILRVSSLKIISDVLADQPTWLPLLKVEHRGKINKKKSIMMNEV
jgi:hypothetical protein